MKRNGKNSRQLRQAAEAQLALAPKLKPIPAGDLLHELQVHQIELEMQNEQLRLAQTELEASRDRYVDLYEFSPVGYLNLDHKGLINEINLTAAAILKVERNQLAHRRFSQFVAPEEQDRWYLHFLNVLKHDDTQACELAFQHGDGSRFYARLTCLCLKTVVQEAVVRIVLTDISARKRTEDALRDSRESLHRLLNSMAEGAYGTDTSGNCTFVNRAFLGMLGYQSDSEVLGKHIHELIHHSHADGSPYPASECRAYRAYRANQLCHVANEVFWRKDGVAIPVEYWSHPIEAGGAVIGAIATFIDITERQQAESLINGQLNELRRWQEAMQGREMRVLELKHEVNGLLTQAGQLPRYPSAE